MWQRVGESGAGWGSASSGRPHLALAWGYIAVFLGQFHHSLDSKGRLTIPAKFRAELATGLVITRGIDRCLVVFPIEAWQSLSKKVNDLPMTDRRARIFKRRIFSAASDEIPDKQGRILIPPRLREYAGLEGEVLVAGVSDTIEVWNTERWDDEGEQLDRDDFDVDDWAVLGI